MKRFIIYQLPWIAYAGLIIIVSSISKLPDPNIEFEYLDKLAHFGEYFIFLLLTYRALANLWTNGNGLLIYVVAIVLSIVFAALDEYHQSFVRGRESDTYDLLADSIGIILGALLHFLYKRRRQATSSQEHMASGA